MSSGLLSLKWNNHRTTFFHVLSTIRSKDSYSDVTLACEGRFYSLHKFVLATCSEYFEQIFQKTQCRHPVIVLKDISFEDLEALLNYMYIGEVNVVQEKLSGLIKAAECLRIKGLAVPDEEEALSTKEDKTNSQQHSQKRSQRSEDSPRAKRRRRNASSDGPTEDASDHERSFDRSKFKSSNQQYNSSFQRQSSLNDNDRGLSQENGNELSISSHSSLISSRISRDSNECRDNIEQVDHLSGVKMEPFESEVVSVSPEIPPTPPDTKEGILDGLIEDSVGHTSVDGSFEDLHGQPVDGTSSHCPQEALWKAEGSCSYEALEDASTASVRSSTSTGGRRPSISFEDGSYCPLSSTSGGSTNHDPSFHKPSSRRASFSHAHSSNSPITSSSVYSIFDESSSPAAPPPPPPLPFSNAVSSDGGVAKEFQCPKCPYTTEFGNNLKIHLRTHTGERPYACPLCDYRGTQRFHVQRHMRTHTGEKPFACPYCPYRCNRKDHLKGHILVLHKIDHRKRNQSASSLGTQEQV